MASGNSYPTRQPPSQSNGEADMLHAMINNLNIRSPYRKYPSLGVPCADGTSTFQLNLRREQWWQMLQEHAWKEKVMMQKFRLKEESKERQKQEKLREREQAEEKEDGKDGQKKQRKDSLVTEKDVASANTSGRVAAEKSSAVSAFYDSSGEEEDSEDEELPQPEQARYGKAKKTSEVKNHKEKDHCAEKAQTSNTIMAKNKQQQEKPSLSFDDMIKADRQKRKAENLAQEIFGKSRRQSAPQNNSNNKRSQTPVGGSLASRVGITKRSSSAASLPTLGKQHQNRGAQKNRNNRQQLGGADTRRDAAYQTAAQQAPPASFNIKPRSFATVDSEITIRGAAGPYCVVASNFAPGTTAADIESVMAPVGGEMSGCKLVSASPTVIAEMLFLDKAGADNVINMFNGKKADGRILCVYLKEGGPSQSLRSSATPRVASPIVVTQPEIAQEQGAEDTMEIEQTYPTEPSPLPPHEPSPRPAYNNSRPRDGRASYREDYDRGNRHAEPDYQDGRYGFNEQRYNEPRYDDRRPRYRDEGRMYSDDMMRGGSRRGGGGRGGGRYRG
ncbi:hypothetical protein KCU81_g6007, partial [Aureobasidium melanogenum]